MKEIFEHRRFTGQIKVTLDKPGKNPAYPDGRVWEASKAAIASAIINVCEEYKKHGDTLTLRQLYYQLVAADAIPNHDVVYKKLGKIKDDLVYSGMVDWAVFEDRGRVPSRAYFEHNVADAFKRTKNSYKLNRQLNQPNHLEVWTEKDAISAVLARITNPYTIMLVVNKGYTSSTAMYGSYVRFVKAFKDGKKVKILYFGDHDPSGLDMIRDIRDRIELMFVEGQRKNDLSDMITEWAEKVMDDNDDGLPDEVHDNDDYWSKYPKGHEDYGKIYFNWYRYFFREHFEVIPIGLTMEQIKEYDPPHNPAKITDPRAKEYVAEFGQVSWEVDALKPNIMRSIVSKAIDNIMDWDIYNAVLKQEKRDTNKITKIIDNLNNDEEE